jgi:Fe2+ or Zn2+ uptake regulation protein
VKNAHDEELSSVESVLDLIRSSGGRSTGSRRALLEVLFDSGEHRTAEELARAVKLRAPDVHLSTVYRNLEELEQLGVIVHNHLGHGPVTYQLVTRTHAHLLCENCGVRLEAPPSMFRALVASARKNFDFEVDPRHFAISGLCANCRRERDEGARPAE